MLSALNVLAVAPHPDLVERWKADGVLDQKLAPLRAFKAAGGNSPELHTPISKDRFGNALSLGTDWIDTAYTIVILVEFTDWPMSGGAVHTQNYQFDSVLFSEDYHNPTGSMTDFYLENSYGNFIVTGDIFGPFTMPKSYQYYENDNYGLTLGGLLATHAVWAVADSVPNWNKYDANGDGYCDGLVIIHAGPGAEEAGDDNIWSHKSNINPMITHDGVKISAYTMNPEEFQGQTSPIGVFCHEFGHVLGLPDLYDISGTTNSNGVGDWAIMASGSYNGNARTPSHFTAWSKAEIGFLPYQEIDENVKNAEFPCSELNPVAYRLRNDLSRWDEFWVVENRQQVGFDVGLPSSGLCIYHVDRHAPGPSNQNPAWYHVALEQADGKNDLAFGGSHGDGGDVWPGSTGAREFHDLTVPNTHTNILGPFNNDATTRIGVWNISDSGSVMTANLDVDWSRPWPLLTATANDSIIFDDSPPGGDGDGILEPRETIRVYVTMKNAMRTSFNATVSLTGDNPAVTFVTNQALLASVFDETEQSNLTPIEFTLAPSFVPAIDSFQLTVTCDSLPSIPYDSVLSRTFGLEVRLGPPQVLIVDDDRGEDYEQVYIDAMYAENIPHAVWHKQSKSSPTGDELRKYPMVFWHTGDSAVDVFTSADVAAMKEYLDAGGNLLLSSNCGAKSLNDLDVGFMNDYLGANLAGGTGFLRPSFNGVTGNEFGDGTNYYYGDPPSYHVDCLTPVGSGRSAFYVDAGPQKICGVTKQGTTYNSIFLTFSIEFVSDEFTSWGYNTKQELFSRVLDMFGGIPLDVDDGRTHAALPMNFDLHQNYPNPFNPSTTISYTLRPTSGRLPRTTLSIFNLLGQQVVTLVDKVQLPGTYNVQWDGSSKSGQQVATGIYFYKLSRGDDSQSKKMILLK